MITNIKIAGNVGVNTPCEISLNAAERTFITTLLAKICAELLEEGIGHTAVIKLWCKICADSKTYWPEFLQPDIDEPKMNPDLYGLELSLLAMLLTERGLENE